MIFDVALQLAPTGGNNLLSSLMNLVIFGMIFASFFFGQQIQSRIAILQLDGAVRKLEFIKSDAKALALRTIREIGKPKDDPCPLFRGFLSSSSSVPWIWIQQG